MLATFVLGATFLLSGFVKIADPMGMVNKFFAYAMTCHIPIDDDSLILKFCAVSLGVIEFILGVYLIMRLRRKIATRFAALFMFIFTALTIWIYIESPVPDCGCFGDAITLTNGQTLLKNIVLLVLSVYLLYTPIRLRRFVSERNAWLLSIFSWVYAITLSLYVLHYLPVIEFTSYKPNANIRKALSGEDIDGAEKLANFFLFDSKTGEDLSYTIVADTGYTFLLTVPNIATADDGCCDRINDIYDYCMMRQIKFYMATASDSVGIMDWGDRTGAAYPVLQAEETELKAMVRSNPGLLLIHNGNVAAKWSNNNLPELDSNSASLCSYLPDNKDLSPLLKLILWFIVPLLCITLLDSIWIGHKFYKHHIYIKRFKLKRIMRKKIVAGNWKMNKNLQEGVALAKELNEALIADKPNCDVVICTPFIHLASVANVIDSNLIGLGAENCADKVSGAYTGEVSAEMVKSTGANYVILGHSERRAYYHETPEILKEKVNLALENNLEVIFCIGEVLEEREANKQNEVVKAQLEGSLFNLTAEQFSHIILAYEPVWAIGTGKTATAEQAEEMHAFIRATIAEKFGAEAAENVSILYGGSCKPSNAKEIFSKVNVDGGLIGGAALKVADFKGIIDAWKA